MKEFVATHQSTLTTFLGALAGGAIAMSVIYAFMPNTNPIQANSKPAPVAAHSSNSGGGGLGSCTVESAGASDDGAGSVVTKAAYMPAMHAHHSIEKVFSHTSSSNTGNHNTNTTTNSGNTTSNSNNTTTNTTNNNSNSSSSSATGSGGLLGLGLSNNLLNNSLNNNDVSVPVLSGNDVNVLNNSDVLSENDVLNDSNVLNDVLDGTVLVKSIGGLL